MTTGATTRIVDGMDALADPSDDLLARVVRVAAATGAILTETQAHDICQALADEIALSVPNQLTPPPEEPPQ